MLPRISSFFHILSFQNETTDCGFYSNLNLWRCIIALLFVTAPIVSIHLAFAQDKNLSNAIQIENNKIPNIATYENKDFGFKVEYPSSWIVLEDYLEFHTIALFELIHTDIYDFTNTTLAEIDLKIIDNPNDFSAKNLTLDDIDTSGQTIISAVNATIGPLPGLKLVDYTLDDITTKHMQAWTVLPKSNKLFLIYYIAQPSLYDQYLPVMEHMINSFKLIG